MSRLPLRPASQQAPQRLLRGLRPEIPQRDVPGRQGEVRDPAASDPHRGREPKKSYPQIGADVGSVLAQQQRAVGIRDAGGDEPIGRQMGVRPRVTVAAQAVVCVAEQRRVHPSA